MGAFDALLEGFDEGRHPRGVRGRWIATFTHSVHGTTTTPIMARSAAEAHALAQAHAQANSGGRVHMTLQGVAPARPPAIHSDATSGRPKQGISDPKAARAALHPVVSQALSSLGQGRWYSPPSGGGHVRRTPQGFEVYPHGSPDPVKTHKTPSAAAGHVLRLGQGVDQGVTPRGGATAGPRMDPHTGLAVLNFERSR